MELARHSTGLAQSVGRISASHTEAQSISMASGKDGKFTCEEQQKEAGFRARIRTWTYAELEREVSGAIRAQTGAAAGHNPGSRSVLGTVQESPVPCSEPMSSHTDAKRAHTLSQAQDVPSCGNGRRASRRCTYVKRRWVHLDQKETLFQLRVQSAFHDKIRRNVVYFTGGNGT